MSYRRIFASANDRRHAAAVAREQEEAQAAEQNGASETATKLALLEAHFRLENARCEIEKARAALASLPGTRPCYLSDLTTLEVQMALLAVSNARDTVGDAIRLAEPVTLGARK